MKILYLSCHAILEYDELKLFTELGYDCFSLGAYSNPQQRGLMRPNIPEMKYHADLHSVALQGNQENLPEELIEWCDVVIMMHNARVNVEDHPQPWLANNWERLKRKKIVWRSIGQSTQQIEEAIAPFRAEGLKIVRYSPREEHIPGYQGSDAMIRFYKPESEYKNWKGTKRQVISFAQSYKKRGDHLHYDVFLEATAGFQRLVFGSGNEELGNLWGGLITSQEQIKQLQNNAVYFYTGTSPASYTLSFLESWMSGIPIVAVGPKIADKIYGMPTYEVHELIRQGHDGFWSDDVAELREYTKRLLDDEELSKTISNNGRDSAIRHFGKFTIASQWQNFLMSL